MSEDGSLNGQHAVVTGASRGIGAAIVRALAERGASVSMMARGIDALDTFRDSLREHFDGRFESIGVDVTDAKAVKAAFARARKTNGAPTILVNNAGNAEAATFSKTDPSLWHRMIALNLTSAYLACREVLPAMTKAGYGRIVNIASTAGVKGYAYVTAYAAAKHGLVGFTRSLSLELVETGVKINAVCPGYADTEMLRASATAAAKKTGRSAEDILREYGAANPHGRLVRPEEVAEAAVRLCGTSRALPTGEVTLVDGSKKMT